ncbi:MAG: hypothetical protein IJ089_00355 [Clostridia bacterium]|nr:hypothetical protein [Clostridia bacterium]
MATKTITELSAVNNLSETDVFVIDDGAHNYKISWSTLKALLGTVASMTVDNTAGTITLTLSNGSTITVTPHDPTKQDTMTFDNIPTANSNNPVKSGGVKAALDDKLDKTSYVRFTGASEIAAGTDGFVPAPAAGNPRYLSSEGVWNEPDSAPTQNSVKLITSDAVYAALQALTLDAATKITGILPVGHGGSGLNASPSLLVNLASAAAANVMQASPRPGVTGILQIENGGTGATAAAGARTNLEVYSKAEVDSAIEDILQQTTQLAFATVPANGELDITIQATSFHNFRLLMMGANNYDGGIVSGFNGARNVVIPSMMQWGNEYATIRPADDSWRAFWKSNVVLHVINRTSADIKFRVDGWY